METTLIQHGWTPGTSAKGHQQFTRGLLRIIVRRFGHVAIYHGGDAPGYEDMPSTCWFTLLHGDRMLSNSTDLDLMLASAAEVGAAA